MIHKLSTQMNVGQEAEGSGGAAGKRKTGLRPSLTRYDAVVKDQNQISWRLFPAGRGEVRIKTKTFPRSSAHQSL